MVTPDFSHYLFLSAATNVDLCHYLFKTEKLGGAILAILEILVFSMIFDTM